MSSLLEGRRVYPHLKFTSEKFPRVLATRIRRDDGDEYFGPFLTKTGVRLLMGFVNRTFRPRSCDVEIDGDFPIPCTRYFAKRCVAPCVAEICGREGYFEIVDAVRLFLANDRAGFAIYIQQKIEAASGALDFEGAAAWRDRLVAVKEFWSRPRWQPWLDDAMDTCSVAESGGEIVLQVVTTRGRRMLGSLVYQFAADRPVPELLSDFLLEFYRHHLPREIRLPVDLRERKRVNATLFARFGRMPKIRVVRSSARPVGVERALARASLDGRVRGLGARTFAPDAICEQWAELGLDREPAVIEAYDAAHISATSFAAGAAIWTGGRLAAEAFESWISDRKSEPATLAAFAARRLAGLHENGPDLVLIDGGLGQLRAVLKALSPVSDRALRAVAAVKPKGRHSEISHFLTEDEKRIDFDGTKQAHLLLQRLRDEAHEVANAAHRQLRDMRHFYADSGREMLVVPIRYVELGGEADDLRPIEPR